MQLAVVQLDIAWEDKPANHRTIEAMLEAAAVPRGAFVLLPELGDTGFSFDLDRIVDDRTLPWAADVARRRGVWVQAGFAERGPDGRGRNCAAVVTPDGDVAGTYEKVHPFSYGREGEHYGGGDHLLVRRCGPALVCPLICYDLRFPELWRVAALAGGAELFTIGASWPEARRSHWRALLVARAIENQAYVVAANRTGHDPHFGYQGGSIAVAPSGAVLAELGAEPGVLQAELDLDELREWRRQFPALRDARPELLGGIRLDGPTDGATRHPGSDPAHARSAGPGP